MPVDPAARYQVDAVAFNQPGVCFLCRSHVGPVIRTGLRHDFFKEAPDASRDGDVYICHACVIDMFNTFGQADGTQVRLTTSAYKTGYQAGLIQGRRMLDDFSRSYSTYCGVDTGIVPDGLIGLLTGDNSSDPGSEQPGPVKPVKVGKQVIGTVVVEGSDDVPSSGVDGILDDIDDSL